MTQMCSIKKLFLEISKNLQKNICARVLYYTNNWYHFIKEYLEEFSKFAFQKIACLVGQPDIFWKFYSRRHTLVAQNHWASVRLHHWLRSNMHLHMHLGKLRSPVNSISQVILVHRNIQVTTITIGYNQLHQGFECYHVEEELT